MKQEGPKEIEIPARAFLSCYGCDFHKSKLWSSGRNPVYTNNCHHPEFPYKQSGHLGNLNKEEDGHIITPKECPFIKKKPNDSAGTAGHGTSGYFQKAQIDYDGQNKEY